MLRISSFLLQQSNFFLCPDFFYHPFAPNILTLIERTHINFFVPRYIRFYPIFFLDYVQHRFFLARFFLLSGSLLSCRSSSYVYPQGLRSAIFDFAFLAIIALMYYPRLALNNSEIQHIETTNYVSKCILSTKYAFLHFKRVSDM